MSDYQEPGARWLRCDLHVHTPWDAERTFGENIKHAIAAFKKEKPQKLTEIASRFIEACRAGAAGEGLDLVALTDHNSIEGYRTLKPFIDAVAQQVRAEGEKVPIVLPGVEFSVGGERPLHFLVVFAVATNPDEIEAAIRHAFGARECFDPTTGTPRATGNSVDEFLRKLFDYCRPSSGERNLSFVVIPAHADSARGIASETASESPPTVATGIWDEMRGHLRQRVITRQDWNGFQTVRAYADLPESFRELLAQWQAARRGLVWDDLDGRERSRIRDAVHWPLIECSDPHRYDQVGLQYCLLKMEVPDVEGIRLALLDPESRLRRSADGQPRRVYPFIRRLTIRNTDFFDEIEVPLNPCLSTLIGGRGSGKSTVLECLRYALDRARPSDFGQDDSDVHGAVTALLGEKSERDFGETPGTLLPDHEVVVEFEVAGRVYEVTRSARGLEVVPEGQAGPAAVDLRALLAPRILSQRQIAQIARSPAAQRRELDALVDAEAIREFEGARRDALIEMERLQTRRRDLTARVETLPSRETELLTVRDQIAFLELGANQTILAAFTAYQREERWLDQLVASLEDTAARLDEESDRLELDEEHMTSLPEGPTRAWIEDVGGRATDALGSGQQALKQGAAALRALVEVVTAERQVQWAPGHAEARASYEELRQEMAERGVAFDQHEALIRSRAALEDEVSELTGLKAQLEELGTAIRAQRDALVQRHEERLALRRGLAAELEADDADIRLDLVAFGDQVDFASRRDEWFGGAGLQERDWDVLVDYVFASNGSVSDHLHGLADALRHDIEASALRDTPLPRDASEVARLLGDSSTPLTGYFFNALQRRERIRLDEMERFLPEDRVAARVRGADGSFKPIEQGSIGQRSTAIVALLLTAGDQPLLIDQPEDDLDNQYVYDVVVDLLRKRKFSRQILIATHNANIPVNGDAELITALEVDERLGAIMTAGSIDRQDVKDAVAQIMEGSSEAFRLRRERYGF